MNEVKADTPLVSIGVPMFNADRYLRIALDSLLAQDYQNLEIVLSDDGSTDKTAAICDEYTCKDTRIRYVRNEKNLGAAANFNQVFRTTNGEFFMWAAFDDLRHPQYVRKCVEALQPRREAVMCCTDVSFIDEEGNGLPYELYRTNHPSGSSISEQIDSLTRVTNWVDVYSLIRRSALLKTRGFLPVFGGDVILIAELCLQGPVLHIPETLWTVRMFGSKSGLVQAQSLLPTTGREGMTTSYSDFACDLLKAIAASNLNLLRRLELALRCIRNCAGTNKSFRLAIVFDQSRPFFRAVQQGRVHDAIRVATLRMVAFAFHAVGALIKYLRSFIVSRRSDLLPNCTVPIETRHKPPRDN